jgi:hypothetical protein
VCQLENECQNDTQHRVEIDSHECYYMHPSSMPYLQCIRTISSGHSYEYSHKANNNVYIVTKCMTS